MTLTVGSLFSGIGGLDLGLERSGMQVIWNSEIDPYASRVLAKHWPAVPNLGDVTTIDWSDVERPDLICGGFPCQDVSDAGRRAGIEGEQSGLWAYFAQAIRHLRPRYVLVENTPGLLARGMGRVLGDLADVGYDAEWDCLPAAALGSPQLRARIWVLAYPRCVGDPPQGRIRAGWQEPGVRAGWLAEPPIRRMDDGVPARMVRPELAVLGNAVLPQFSELIGRRIVQALEGAA